MTQTHTQFRARTEHLSLSVSLSFLEAYCMQANPCGSLSLSLSLSLSWDCFLRRKKPLSLSLSLSLSLCKSMSSIQICVLNLLIVCVLTLQPVLGLNTTILRHCTRPSFTPNITTNPEEADLKVLVPNITTLRQFVDCSDPAHVRGFCIDVFEKALSTLIPSSLSNMSIHYTCFNFSSMPSGPTYNDMVEFVANGTYDAVVGDVTIGAHRSSRVDFTQQYMESGVVILTKVAPHQFSPWILFGSPFSLRMWCTVVGAFAFTGFLICFLEHTDHPEFTHGRIIHRFDKILWFMIHSLFLLEKESVKSTVARLVMVAWVFFVILLSASYTAGLSSFLTASSLSPPTQDILSLKGSGKDLGYRRGSIVLDYLVTRFHIPEKQLKAIRSVSDFVNNITNGPDHNGVIAIVDELPYANSILSNLSSSTCDYTITGPQLTSEGFGFGFNKERNLAANFSIAILNLIESGCLQEIQDSFNMSGSSICSTSNSFSTQVSLENSLALFIPLVGVLSICIFVHYVKRYFRSRHTSPNERPNLIDDDSTRCMLNDDLSQRRRHGKVELIPLSSLDH